MTGFLMKRMTGECVVSKSAFLRPAKHTAQRLHSRIMARCLRGQDINMTTSEKNTLIALACFLVWAWFNWYLKGQKTCL